MMLGNLNGSPLYLLSRKGLADLSRDSATALTVHHDFFEIELDEGGEIYPLRILWIKPGDGKSIPVLEISEAMRLLEKVLSDLETFDD